MSKEVLKLALEVLIYHADQTRPIHRTSEAIAIIKKELAKQEHCEYVEREWPIMGYGGVAIGRGHNKEDGMNCLIYLKLDGPREINADTTDVFPVGREVPQDKLLACVYFKDGAAMQQTIEVLQEMQTEIGYTTQQANQEHGEPVWPLEDCVRLLKTLNYIEGIAAKGEGRQMRDDESLEQFILGYVKRLETQPKQEQGETVAWNEDRAYAWGRSYYEIAQGATTGWKLFGQLTPKEQAYWVAKAAFEQATPQPKQEQGEPVAYAGVGGLLIDDQLNAVALPVGTRLYTTPQQRKPLMDEQIDDEHDKLFPPTIIPSARKLVRDFARAIEAAHGIQEGGTS